ncbi:MAG: hypothetical protein ACQESR_19155 [Planctomycetota bacterium]
MSPDLMERSPSSEALSTRQWQPLDPPPPRNRRRDFYSDSTSAGRLEAVPFGAHDLVFEEPIPSWSYRLLMEISELGELPSGWDSYGAQPIDPQCALAAADFVLEFLDDDSPQPAIVPTTRGGIQLEWHRSGADLEIEIQSPTKLEVFFEDERTGEEQQLSLSVNFAPLLPMLQRVTQAD